MAGYGISDFIYPIQTKEMRENDEDPRIKVSDMIQGDKRLDGESYEDLDDIQNFLLGNHDSMTSKLIRKEIDLLFYFTMFLMSKGPLWAPEPLEAKNEKIFQSCI